MKSWSDVAYLLGRYSLWSTDHSQLWYSGFTVGKDQVCQITDAGWPLWHGFSLVMEQQQGDDRQVEGVAEAHSPDNLQTALVIQHQKAAHLGHVSITASTQLHSKCS